MQVKLKNNTFKATQWFKDGDHPAVRYRPDELTKYTSIDERYYIETVYDYDDWSSCVEPGMWIVEMFDGIHLYSDDVFKVLFVDAEPERPIPIESITFE